MSFFATSSDDELIGAFIDGESAAMEALFRRYRKPVFGWVLRMVENCGEAEDLYQDIWLKVIKRAQDYATGHFKAWMWRIARNCVIDHLRKNRPDLVLDAPLSDDEDAEKAVDRITDDAAACALENMEMDERRAILRSAISELSPALKEVVLLRINGECEFREIAEMLNLPIGTVLGRMHLAVAKMKETLKRKGWV